MNRPGFHAARAIPGAVQIDLRSIRPLDTETILGSVRRTGRLLTVDNAHLIGGVSAEISDVVAEYAFEQLQVAPERLGFPDTDEPCARRQLLPPAARDSLEVCRDARTVSGVVVQWLLWFSGCRGSGHRNHM